jgi:hypothetical protein
MARKQRHPTPHPDYRAFAVNREAQPAQPERRKRRRRITAQMMFFEDESPTTPMSMEFFDSIEKDAKNETTAETPPTFSLEDITKIPN